MPDIVNELIPKGWKAWVKSLVAATISGSANAFFIVQMMPEKFQLSDLESIGKLVLAGAMIGFFGYLKKSPLPE